MGMKFHPRHSWKPEIWRKLLPFRSFVGATILRNLPAHIAKLRIILQITWNIHHSYGQVSELLPALKKFSFLNADKLRSSRLYRRYVSVYDWMLLWMLPYSFLCRSVEECSTYVP